MKLYNTLNNLILEVATADQITDAIKNKKVCVIYYDGDEPGGKGLKNHRTRLPLVIVRREILC
jgi:hypothetical protein